MSNQKELHRRSFMKGTAAGAAAGIYSYGIVPNTVFAAPDRPAPSDQLLFGHIGIGGRGSGFLRPGGSSSALCDVDQRRLERAAERVGGTPRLFTDYRELLDLQDIDAVFIASPDHWHALHTVHACEAGKDVYVEKPASVTMSEGYAMVEAANRYARVVQVGSQGRSTDGAYHACKYVQNGQIGTVSEVRCWHYPSPVGDWTPNETPPEDLAYDNWIGPAPYIPYNERRTHGRFRWMMFSGGGQIRDRGAHVMSVAMWIMDSDHTGPVSVDATGFPPHDGMYDTGVHMKVVYEFKNPDWTLIWEQPGEEHKRDYWKYPRQTYGANYVGDKDNLIVLYGDTPETDTETKAIEYEVPADGKQVFHSPGHRENFEDCIRSREKPIMNIEAGVAVATLCILGNISFVLQRKLEWDPVNKVIKDDEEATRLMHSPGRGIYNL